MVEGLLYAAVLALSAALLRLWLMLRDCRVGSLRAREELAAALAVPSRESAQWQATLRGMPDGLMVLDKDLRLVEWNQHFPEMVGLQAEHLRVGMGIAEILRLQAEAGEFGDVDIEQEVERRVELIKEGISTGTIERRRPNGRTIQLRRSPLDEGGFVTLYTDVTERLRTEDQLRQAQKMEAIGYLTGGIAHDFNNLLTVVIGNIELAQGAMQAGSLLRALAKLEDAKAGAERGATLTRRLLAYSRRQTLDPRPSDVNRIVANMSELIRSSIGPISLETVLAGELWQTIIDPNQLENALLNLAINARDAMPDGGKITIETANASLDAAYAAAHDDVTPGRYVMVAVSDGGTGMSPEAIQRAFEPFFTTKEVGKGSGLGLSQVFGFIKQSKGHVKIYSELGVGTTVKLYLPYSPSEALRTTETAPLPPAIRCAVSGEVVLMVEDDAEVLGLTKESLEFLGYHVIAAKDAAAALAALTSHDVVSLLLTDIQLPDKNGPELADLARKIRPALPVLYTSGYAAMAVLHRGLLDRHVKTITKPFALAQLATAIRDAIDNPSD